VCEGEHTCRGTHGKSTGYQTIATALGIVPPNHPSTTQPPTHTAQPTCQQPHTLVSITNIPASHLRGKWRWSLLQGPA
jgi:hypothetical protein